MSNDIFETNELQVTAFVGNHGKSCVQISLKANEVYAVLNDEETLELAHALISRLLCKKGYAATD